MGATSMMGMTLTFTLVVPPAPWAPPDPVDESPPPPQAVRRLSEAAARMARIFFTGLPSKNLAHFRHVPLGTRASDGAAPPPASVQVGHRSRRRRTRPYAAAYGGARPRDRRARTAERPPLPDNTAHSVTMKV